MFNSNAEAVVFLDDTPKSHWRVSSPNSLTRLMTVSPPPDSRIPFLLLRNSDWSRFSSYLSSRGNKLYILLGESGPLDLANTSLLTCTRAAQV